MDSRVLEFLAHRHSGCAFSRDRSVAGTSTRPTIILRQSKIFPTDKNAFQGVVLLEISSVLRAVSVRAEMINGRLRIIEIVLISSSS